MTQVTLTEFLLARIAEDEAVAKVAAVGVIDNWESWPESRAAAVWLVTKHGRASGVRKGHHNMRAANAGMDECEHIARFDPARVLAECEAKRRIVGLISSPGPQALRLLALPYADHPDYLPEWKP